MPLCRSTINKSQLTSLPKSFIWFSTKKQVWLTTSFKSFKSEPKPRPKINLTFSKQKWTIYHTFLHRNLIMWIHVQYSTCQQSGGGNAQSYATDSRVESEVEPSGSGKHFMAGLQLATPSGFHHQSEGHSCKSIRHTGIFQYGTQPCSFPARRWMLVFRVNEKKNERKEKKQ